MIHDILLYFDADTQVAKAAQSPPSVSEASAIAFGGRTFRRLGQSSLLFWDYLVTSDGRIVGVMINDFELPESLVASRLFSQAANVRREAWGFSFLFATIDEESETDGAQAFGCEIFQDNHDCLLWLPRWDEREYGFQLQQAEGIAAMI